MNPNPHVNVSIDLERVRQNVREIAKRSGVPVIAVVKADAYGLGAREIAAAIAELVEAFYVFDAKEAVRYKLHPLTGKRTIALLAESDDPEEYIAHRINPCVWTEERARALRTAGPVVSVDTGQQRFACAAEAVAAVLKAGDAREAMTHASMAGQAAAFAAATEGMGELFRHAAGSRLLDEPAARFDAVRPGMAIYRGAARVSARLIEARDGNGPAGYSGFVRPRFGVIRCGYSNGFRVGPCVVNGRRRRVLEVGMQSAFVELGAGDRCGDEVMLLGDDLTEDDVAAAWGTTAQEALLRLCGAGVRSYR